MKKKNDLLREYVDYICENCKRHEKEVGTLEAHRIHRGVMGGSYDHRNIKMVCKSCHKLFHSHEPGIGV